MLVAVVANPDAVATSSVNATVLPLPDPVPTFNLFRVES
jgi:hypothetical protein